MCILQRRENKSAIRKYVLDDDKFQRKKIKQVKDQKIQRAGLERGPLIQRGAQSKAEKVTVKQPPESSKGTSHKHTKRIKTTADRNPREGNLELSRNSKKVVRLESTGQGRMCWKLRSGSAGPYEQALQDGGGEASVDFKSEKEFCFEMIIPAAGCNRLRMAGTQAETAAATGGKR